MDLLSGVVNVRVHGKSIMDRAVNSRISWNAMQLFAVRETTFINDDWLFKYEDEENDHIVGSTEAEWRSALQLASSNHAVIINVHPVGCCAKNTSAMNNLSLSSKEDCVYVTSKSSRIKPKSAACSEELTGACCPTSVKCCAPSIKKCCETDSEKTYDRPMPDPYVDDGKPLLKIINPTLEYYKYTEDSLRAVTLPLGPIGGGNIAIAGDGGLRQWQINNKVSHNAHLPDSFFAIKIGETAAVLQSNTWYDQKDFKPAPVVSDHVVPDASKFLLSKCPGVKTIEVTAKYPIVEVDYSDAALANVKVHLEAWSPKIPLNSKDSGIPIVVFDFSVTNNSKENLEISLLASLQNSVGWNAYDSISNEVNSARYGGNVNALFTQGNLFGIDMSNVNLPTKDAFNGHSAIVAVKESTDHMSTLLQYSSVENLWNSFSHNTLLPGQGEVGQSKPGSTFNGAVNTTRTVEAGKTTVFTYMLAWHFPNRYKDWSIGVNIPNTDIWVGNQYTKFWKTISDVLTYTDKNMETLKSLTYKFRDSMFDSSLPWQLVDSAAGRASVLNSPCCMWHNDGNFYAFEGCSTNSGCCPLNCTHVWNFEMALAMLYPDLERTMREVDLLHQITPHGVIPSRTPCPLELKRLWSTWENYSTDPASTAICVDGEIGTVFKTYREYKHGASLKWLQNLWNPLKAVMNHWLNVLDADKKGIIFGPQPNTYDVATYGYMVVIGCLYLCGLRAMEEMSKIMGDTNFEKICHDRFMVGSVNLDKECFTNGKWYTQVVDPNHTSNLLTDSTQIGALYGQWWAHILGLGYLLPQDHIKSHLMYTYKRNYVESFDPSTQKPRVFCDQRDSNWITAKWDAGHTPARPMLYASEWAWSGVSYPFATLLLKEGLMAQGLDVLQKTREMFDGTRRSPWNEIECGDHYARPMSAFGLFSIASGQNWTVESNGSINLTFNPIIASDDYQGFFILGSCWGTYNQNVEMEARDLMLKLEYGLVVLNSFTIKSTGLTILVTVGTQKPVFTTSLNDGFTTIHFTQALHLEANDVLTVTAY